MVSAEFTEHLPKGFIWRNCEQPSGHKLMGLCLAPAREQGFVDIIWGDEPQKFALSIYNR